MDKRKASEYKAMRAALRLHLTTFMNSGSQIEGHELHCNCGAVLARDVKVWSECDAPGLWAAHVIEEIDKVLQDCNTKFTGEEAENVLPGEY